MLPKLNSNIIEVLVANYFDYRKNIIIPNVSWGLLNHEADVLIVRPKTGYCIEVEIKISKADLKADLKKGHNHKDSRIKELWYCMPENMIELAINILPEHVGLLAVCDVIDEPTKYGYLLTYRRISQIRKAESIKNSNGISEKEINRLLHLGIMRIWRLKAKTLPKTKKHIEKLPELF